MLSSHLWTTTSNILPQSTEQHSISILDRNIGMPLLGEPHKIPWLRELLTHHSKNLSFKHLLPRLIVKSSLVTRKGKVQSPLQHTLIKTKINRCSREHQYLNTNNKKNQNSQIISNRTNNRQHHNQQRYQYTWSIVINKPIKFMTNIKWYKAWSVSRKKSKNAMNDWKSRIKIKTR